MNKEQVKGTVKHVAGKLQQKTGEITGSSEQQVKGMKKQVEGAVQRNLGDLKKDVKQTGKH